jgi:formyltetrahydrofolate-dependent phosphoribosylglycinamide formyltransferase
VSARVAVLASGGGTNLQALLDHFAARGVHASGAVALVLSDRPTAGALERAHRAGIQARYLAPDERAQLRAILDAAGIDVVALAGYLRLVPNAVTAAYPGRIVNVHPALLPAFGGTGMYGRHVHAAVLAAGVCVTGATVHFVNEEYDRGSIIAQWPVPVRSDDSPETLAARVLVAEHTIYPPVVDALCAGSLHLASDGTVAGRPEPDPGAAFRLQP